MRTCFVCGNKYDDKNRVTATSIYNITQEKTYTINSIALGEKKLRLCPNCIKAAVIGMHLCREVGFGNEWITDETIKFEESRSHRIKNIDSNGEQS